MSRRDEEVARLLPAVAEQPAKKAILGALPAASGLADLDRRIIRIERFERAANSASDIR